jgi:pimeloyl-ACP methyl ester carboxylesterase
MTLKDPGYWKDHYVVASDADEIERSLRRRTFLSAGREYELVGFERGPDRPTILISQGSGGHAYVFAELGYLMHGHGYNVFIMPKQSGKTIAQLMSRHADALAHIAGRFNDRIGVYAEGLGGFVAFYLALDHGPMKSLAIQNAPAILTEEKFRRAIFEDAQLGARRRLLIPLANLVAKVLPRVRLPLSAYLDFRKLVDTVEPNRKVERRLVERGYLHDPDFDRWYPLSAILSLISMPPPGPLSALEIPTLFMVARRGFTAPAYFQDLYDRLPPIEKRLVEVDGSVFWMLSHPKEAAALACGWFDETV